MIKESSSEKFYQELVSEYHRSRKLSPLSASPTKWSNTFKQFVGKSRQIVWLCLTILWGWCLKVAPATFLLLCFVCLKEHFWSKKKYFLFHFKSSFHSWDSNFSDIQISWRHQTPKREARNTFYCITWEVNTIWWWNLASLCNITKKNFYQKLLRKMWPGN